jgi:cytochrome P450
MDVLAMLREPARLADPYSLYAELRQRSSRVRLPTGEIVLSRYSDVAAVLKDPRFRKPPLPRPPTKATRVLFQMVLLLDPPDHTRLRRVVAPAFAPSAVATLRSTATLVADRLITSVPSTFDLVRDFAYPLPLAVLSREVGCAGDGWVASEGGVAAVMVVGVKEAVKGAGASAI